MTALIKNGSIDLSKRSFKPLKKIRVGLGWDVQGESLDLDVSAFLCKQVNDEPKLLSEGHFIFYNNLSTPNKSVVHSGDNRTGDGDGDDESIAIDLSLLEPEINEISFIVTIHEGLENQKNFSMVKNAFINIYDDSGKVLCGYKLNELYTNETAVQFGSLCKINGSWNFKAVGAGYLLSLGDFVDGYLK